MANSVDLDDSSRGKELLETIKSKKALYKFYTDCYLRFKKSLSKLSVDGEILELGSGGGFLKEIVPEVKTSDVIAYDEVELVLDARKMQFEDETLKSIYMLNVFHHIPDVEAFLNEAQRCLKSGGSVFITDQHPGWIGKPILKYAHHEPFDDKTQNWSFPSKGPLSDANGALAWVVFVRDRELFNKKFPQLTIKSYRPQSPLLYWMSGGLKSWSLVPGFLYPAFKAIDSLLVKLVPSLGSFVDIEIRKI